MATLAMATFVQASTIVEVEPNNTLLTAQSVDSAFSLDFSDYIGDDMGNNTSLTLPHATVLSTGDGSFDYFSFTVPADNTTTYFDIDFATDAAGGPLDLELFLYTPGGTFITFNDDAPVAFGAAGSTSVRDPFISHTFALAGTYVVGVGRFNSIPLFDGIGGSMLKQGDSYELQISVPEPSTIVLASLGLLLCMAYSSRRLR